MVPRQHTPTVYTALGSCVDMQAVVVLGSRGTWLANQALGLLRWALASFPFIPGSCPHATWPLLGPRAWGHPSAPPSPSGGEWILAIGSFGGLLAKTGTHLPPILSRASRNERLSPKRLYVAQMMVRCSLCRFVETFQVSSLALPYAQEDFNL